MPSAFNSIKRTKLIKILKLSLQEDEVCIIRIPHSNATLAGSDLKFGDTKYYDPRRGSSFACAVHGGVNPPLVGFKVEVPGKQDPHALKTL